LRATAKRKAFRNKQAAHAGGSGRQRPPELEEKAAAKSVTNENYLALSQATKKGRLKAGLKGQIKNKS